MRQGIALLFSALLIGMPAGIAQGSTQDKTEDKAQLISTAQITKIDLKKQTLKVRNVAASMNDGSAGTSQTNTGAGRTGGGGGMPGGMGGGRRGGGGRGGSTGPTNPSDQQMGPEYTVYIGKTTAIKDEDRPMDFRDFKVGDRINITGTQKGSGKDMNASVISLAR